MTEFLQTKVELFDVLIYGGPAIVLLFGFTILLCKSKTKEILEPSQDAKKLINSLEDLNQWDISWIGGIVDYVQNDHIEIRVYKDGMIAKINNSVNEMIQFEVSDRKFISNAVCWLISRKMEEDKRRLLDKLEA